MYIMESTKLKTLYEKFKDEIQFYEQHPEKPTHLEPLNDPYLLQLLINMHKQHENDVNNEIRNIVNDCFVLFDKLFLHLNDTESNELHDLNYKLYKFAMNHKNDNKLFYDTKK